MFDFSSGRGPVESSVTLVATVANPNSETFQMDYDAKGLMTAFTRPKALTDLDPLKSRP